MRPLVASGARINLRSPSLIHTKHPAWQEDAWSYRDSVDELRFAAEFVSNSLGQLRVFAAENRPKGEEPVPLDTTGAVPQTVAAAEGVTEHTRRAATALVDSLNLNQQGSHLLGQLAENFDIAGEAYLLGVAGEENNGMDWTVRSVSELQVTAGGATLLDPHGGGTGRQLRADECDVLRLWNPHPRWQDWPDSPIAAMLGTLEGMVLVARRGRAHDRSRISNGQALYLPWEFSLMRAGDAEDVDEDVDPAMAALTEAMVTPIKDEADPSAVVPIIIRGDAAIGDRPAADVIKTIQLHGDDPQRLDERYEALVGRFSRGINLAQERVTGLGDTNHWNGAVITSDELKMHVRPRAIRIVDSLTQAYLWPGMKAMGVPLEQRRRVCLWFDPAALVENPNRDEAAKVAHEAGVISDQALREELGFGDDHKPSDLEQLRRAVDRERLSPASVPILVELLAGRMPDQRDIAQLLSSYTEGGAPRRSVVDATPRGATPSGASSQALDPAPSAPRQAPPAPSGVTAAGKKRGPADDPSGPSVAGLALMAADTGRVLMLQRGLDDEDDPAAGTWEFPGGHIEDGDETSLHGAMREWAEEVGQPVPDGGAVVFGWTSADGVYQGHVVVIPEESALDLGAKRTVRNADDDYSEQAAWWAPDDARRNPALRKECRRTPWSTLKKVASSVRSPVTAAAAREEARWRVDRRAGRRLVAIDRDLVTTVHAHAEAAVGRAVERAANRIRGRGRDPRFAGADPVGVVAAAGEVIAGDLTPEQLLDGAFDQLETVWHRELGRAARAAEAVLDQMLAGRAVTAAGRGRGVADQIVERGRSAWSWLRERLEQRALDVLFGRVDGDPVPVALVNGAAAQAGGLPELSGGVRDDGTVLDGAASGPGTGESVLSALRVSGAVIAGIEWDYHPGIARETFLAHAKLHEQTFEGRTDAGLAVAGGDEWIPSGFYHPQDHTGCRCGWAPVAIVPMTDSPDPNDPQIAELRAQHIGGTS